jgi:hypothetical protein
MLSEVLYFGVPVYLPCKIQPGYKVSGTKGLIFNLISAPREMISYTGGRKVTFAARYTPLDSFRFSEF